MYFNHKKLKIVALESELILRSIFCFLAGFDVVFFVLGLLVTLAESSTFWSAGCPVFSGLRAVNTKFLPFFAPVPDLNIEREFFYNI